MKEYSINGAILLHGGRWAWLWWLVRDCVEGPGCPASLGYVCACCWHLVDGHNTMVCSHMCTVPELNPLIHILHTYR